MVFQNPDNQFVGATVADDVAFGLENRQVPREKMVEIVPEALKRVFRWISLLTVNQRVYLVDKSNA